MHATRGLNYSIWKCKLSVQPDKRYIVLILCVTLSTPNTGHFESAFQISEQLALPAVLGTLMNSILDRSRRYENDCDTDREDQIACISLFVI